MSDEVTKPFNMVRPFKRPAEDRQTAEQMKREDYDWMVIDRDAWQAVATKATADLDAAQNECKELSKDWEEMSVKLDVAEDEVQVLTERLAKEQKVILQLAEENDLLTVELENRRTAFLQMVVEMGKVSKELLNK